MVAPGLTAEAPVAGPEVTRRPPDVHLYVPDLSPWRRATTVEMTKALPLVIPKTSVPAPPVTSLGDTSVAEQAVINTVAGTEAWACRIHGPRPTPCPPRRRAPPLAESEGHTLVAELLVRRV